MRTGEIEIGPDQRRAAQRGEDELTPKLKGVISRYISRFSRLFAIYVVCGWVADLN
jgi:hypothetical protein